MFKLSRLTQTRMNMVSNDNGFLRHARVPHKVLYALLFTLITVIIVLLLPSHLSKRGPVLLVDRASGSVMLKEESVPYLQYNETYPLTAPVRINGDTQFQIGMVADQDENSRVDRKTWRSWLKTGTLTLHKDRMISVKWNTERTELQSHISEKGRGAELSELVVFNGKLYTVDDRTGIVFEIVHGQLVPWVILEDGPGVVPKGFKGEWMTVTHHELYVGGLGKEWTSQTGEYLNDHPQYVKVISMLGHVEHRLWAHVYKRIQDKVGIKPPGYIIHESACWSHVHARWFFLPRRASKETYNDVLDEARATNIMISADETFTDITVSTLGPLNPYKGFSSFKFVPGTGDQIIVATKSEENKGKIATFMVAFDLDGQPLMKEVKIGDIKYEGIEFI